MSACPICDAELPTPAIRSPDRGQGTPGRFEVAICRDCGAGVTLPRVDASELAAFYPSTYGPHGVERGPLATVSRAIRWVQGRREWRAPPLRSLAERTPGRGVDVGAGRGDLAAMLAARSWRM